MPRELKAIDITNNPDLLRIVEEVRATNEPRVLRRDGEELGVLMPPRPARRRQSRPRPFTKDDPIWNLQGIGRSGVTDVSENTDKYLAEAYLESHGQER